MASAIFKIIGITSCEGRVNVTMIHIQFWLSDTQNIQWRKYLNHTNNILIWYQTLLVYKHHVFPTTSLWSYICVFLGKMWSLFVGLICFFYTREKQTLGHLSVPRKQLQSLIFTLQNKTMTFLHSLFFILYRFPISARNRFCLPQRWHRRLRGAWLGDKLSRSSVPVSL